MFILRPSSKLSGDGSEGVLVIVSASGCLTTIKASEMLKPQGLPYRLACWNAILRLQGWCLPTSRCGVCADSHWLPLACKSCAPHRNI